MPLICLLISPRNCHKRNYIPFYWMFLALINRKRYGANVKAKTNANANTNAINYMSDKSTIQNMFVVRNMLIESTSFILESHRRWLQKYVHETNSPNELKTSVQLISLF